MRIVSLITAAVVIGILYLAVIERETLMSFSRVGSATEETAVGGMAAPGASAEASTEPDARSVAVVARRSEADVIDRAVVVRGRTEAARQVNVRAETSGLVISEPLRKGARIDEGELLCHLDTGTRESALAEAEARLEEARARVADAEINEHAAERLSEGGFASETRLTGARAALRSAQAGIQSAEAAIAAARKELERLEIRAPFSGLLESDTAEIGALLQPGSLCATVIQLEPIRLVGFVPETEVDRVAVGARAVGRLASGREVSGEVSFLSRSADAQTRTFRVEITVPATGGTVRDGQTAEIIIASDGALAHLLPQSALTLDDEGRLGVRLVDAASQAAFAPVSVLRDTIDGIWVAGLARQADVIVVGEDYVSDGVPVVPRYEVPAQ